MNATSTLATPTVARSVFSTRTARQQAAWNPGDHAVTGTTTERAAWFGSFRLFPARQLLPDADPPFGRPSGRRHPSGDARIPPAPDLAPLSHRTGAKP